MKAENYKVEYGDGRICGSLQNPTRLDYTNPILVRKKVRVWASFTLTNRGWVSAKTLFTGCENPGCIILK